MKINISIFLLLSVSVVVLGEDKSFDCDVFLYCISPNVGRYYGLVTGPPPAMEATMEAAATMAMEAAAMETATERF